VSVVIVTFEREEPLLKTLADLLVQNHPAYDITIVDQNEQPLESVDRLAATTDDRLRILRLRPPNVLVARNLGIQATDGEIVLYVDDDVRCGKDFIAEHVARYEAPHVGGVAGWVDAIAAKYQSKPLQPAVESAVGCNMSYRRAVLTQVGGWDLRFKSVPSYGEERELCHRIRRAGYSIATAPKAIVFHDLSPTGGQRPRDPQKYWRAYTSNFVLLFRKTKPRMQQMLFPGWLLKLRFTVWRHSGGVASERTFWRGVAEGLGHARRSREQTDFLASTPRPLFLRPSSKKTDSDPPRKT
jgi:GT2 family glycosyltransferase